MVKSLCDAGEYVAVERLEEAYKVESLVEQVWVYGNSFESALIAVVVPEKAGLQQWASRAGVRGSYEEICKSRKAEQHVLNQLAAAGQAGNLKVSQLRPRPINLYCPHLHNSFGHTRMTSGCDLDCAPKHGAGAVTSLCASSKISGWVPWQNCLQSQH